MYEGIRRKNPQREKRRNKRTHKQRTGRNGYKTSEEMYDTRTHKQLIKQPKHDRERDYDRGHGCREELRIAAPLI